MVKHLFNRFVTLSAHKNPRQCGMTLGPLFNKAFELHIVFSFAFNFMIRGYWTTKQDHCGPNVEIALLGLSIEVQIYDVRHWYDAANRWYQPGEEMRLYNERKAKGLPNPNIILGDVDLLEDEGEEDV